MNMLNKCRKPIPQREFGIIVYEKTECNTQSKTVKVLHKQSETHDMMLTINYRLYSGTLDTSN